MSALSAIRFGARVTLLAAHLIGSQSDNITLGNNTIDGGAIWKDGINNVHPVVCNRFRITLSFIAPRINKHESTRLLADLHPNGLLVFACAAVNAQPTVSNLPASFYNRPGLTNMPRIDYSSLPLIDVKQLGAKGDGVQSSTPYFEQAVRLLVQRGGGIVMCPKEFTRSTSHRTTTECGGLSLTGSVDAATQHSFRGRRRRIGHSI